MALKDWKKDFSTRSGEAYFYNIKNKKYLMINLDYMDNIRIKVNNKEIKFIKKSSTSKSQALKYAKSYMRKH